MTAITWSNLREALEEVDAWVALVEKVEATRPTETVLALWDAEAWKMLDYPNWESLCASRGWTRNVLPMIERREMVADLRAEGMSIPAIASATGASVGTIHNDLSALKGSGVEMPETVRSLDGKTRPATQPVRATVEVIEEPQRTATVNVPTVTEEPEAEAVEVLTADEWAERQGVQLVADEPDPDDLLPEQSKFERRFWQHLRQGQELVKDLDYPQHFNEPMIRLLTDLIEALNRKQGNVTGRGLRVVNGGRQ